MSYLRKFREAKTKAEAKASIMGRIEKLWLEMYRINHTEARKWIEDREVTLLESLENWETLHDYLSAQHEWIDERS